MIGDYKEVYFHEYCKTCKYRDIEDWKDPCNPCLANPCNIDSHKPTYYEKDENVKEQVICGRKTSIDSSYSTRGHNLICRGHLFLLNGNEYKELSEFVWGRC